MKDRLWIVFVILGVILIGVGCTTATSNETEVESEVVADSGDCPASDSWVTDPNPPNEIPAPANICQFHQFSWQWFIALMQEGGGGTRAFQDQDEFPLFLRDENSCTATGVDNQLFVRVGKDDNGQETDFVLPGDNRQAGSGSIIYDQNGNVVYYEVRFSRDQCELDPTTATMFPAGTTELKMSWRVITEAEMDSYVWMEADVNGDTLLLGLVGFHFVRSTADHPEFIWATFEHKLNVPDCQETASMTDGWSFTSATCAGELPNPTSCMSFNEAIKIPTPTPIPLTGGEPTEICRVYADGSRPGDNQYDTNVSNINELNTQLVGSDGFITALDSSNPLAVLQNYELVGALWVTDPSMTANELSNQRGSIQLANTTMETTEQQGFSEPPYTGPDNLQPAANCFACHDYQPEQNICTSHIFSHIFGTTIEPDICK